MRVKLLTFRYSSTLGGFDETALQSFIRDKELLAFREHFFTINEVPHLVCVLAWQDASVGCGHPPEEENRNGPARSTPGRADPTSGLDEPQRILFNSLREWRAERALGEGVPAYLIFTNRQLAEIARTLPESENALGQISGIGVKKVKRYGAALLDLLRGSQAPPPSQTDPTAGP